MALMLMRIALPWRGRRQTSAAVIVPGFLPAAERRYDQGRGVSDWAICSARDCTASTSFRMVNATRLSHVVGTVLPIILINLGQRRIILMVPVSEYHRQQEAPANRYAQNPYTRQ